MNYEIGDFVTLKTIKRKWRLPANTQFKITIIEPKDNTVLEVLYKNTRYIVFSENIKQVFPSNVKVSFT